ncbi:hypothetical protein FB446DRAFT_704117 [Lentinula raphanica]|nr:hypothetical protein FB446DRAFT_704164 [Lentinula raphanica]KAJ3772131.1 hypothetical protein FB446DRAFT_704117 [Lentinula raphanica]
MSVKQHNSRQMYKFNQTATFLQSLSPEMRQWLRKITRDQDQSGQNRREKIELAEYRKNVAEAKLEKQRVREQKQQAATREIDEITPILATTTLEYRASRPKGSKDYLNIAEITKQLKWHKRNGAKDVIPAAENSWGKREEKLTLLKVAIDQYNLSQSESLQGEGGSAGTEIEEDLPEVTVDDLETFEEDGYNSEELYYR